MKGVRGVVKSVGDQAIEDIAADANRRAERDARVLDVKGQLRMAESELLRALANVERSNAAKLREAANPQPGLAPFAFGPDPKHDELNARVNDAQATLFEVQAEACLLGIKDSA